MTAGCKRAGTRVVQSAGANPNRSLERHVPIGRQAPMHVVQGMAKSRRVLRTQSFWPQMPHMCGTSTAQQRTVRETQPFWVSAPVRDALSATRWTRHTCSPPRWRRRYRRESRVGGGEREPDGPVGRLLGCGRPQLGLMFGDAPSFNAVHAVVVLAAECDEEVAAIAAIAAATNKAAGILRFSLVSGPTGRPVWLTT